MGKIAALILLFLLFGCTQQPLQPAQKTLAQELGISPISSYSAHYGINISSPAGDFFGTMSSYSLGENFRADISISGMQEHSIYSSGNASYLCTLEGAEGNCTYTGEGFSFGFALSQPASLFSIEKLPSRKINGIDAKCFSLSQKNSFSYSSSISCYSQEGVLLYSLSFDQKSGTSRETTLIRMGNAPTEEKFRLPYAIK